MSLRMSGERREASGLPRLSLRRAIPAKFLSSQRHHIIRGRAPLDNSEHVFAPSVQGRAFMLHEKNIDLNRHLWIP
jgi:hypothetical protein